MAKPKAGKTLDLHGYVADDVVDAVDRFIVSVSDSDAKSVRIMTGKGKGIVQKIVIDYLKKAGYPWEFERLPNGTRNEGVLVVFIN